MQIGDALIERPKVSLVIVNYRAYAALAACLDSLAPYLGADVEAHLVDHGADSRGGAVLQEGFRGLHLSSTSSNPGFAAGVNRAARDARGRYLLLLNPDCVVHGDVAHTLAAWMDEHPEAGVVGGLVRESDGSLQQSARRFPGPSTGIAGRTSLLTRLWPDNPWSRRNLAAREDQREPVEVDWVTGACMMIRREAFDAVGGMDEGFFLYWEDADICRRIRDAGWSTFYFPTVGVTHLTGRSSRLARTRSLVAFHRSAYRYYMKHGGRRARFAAPIVALALCARLVLKLTAAYIDLGAHRARVRTAVGQTER